MLRHPQAFPYRPESINGGLSTALQHRLDSAAAGGDINCIEAIKTQGRSQITRAQEIRLMDAIDARCGQSRIGLPLRLITAGAAMGQIVSAQNAIDGAQGGQRLNLQFFQFPTDGLRTTEQAFVVKTETNELDRLFDFIRDPMWSGVRTSCSPFKPIRVMGTITSKPFEKPAPRTLQR